MSQDGAAQHRRGDCAKRPLDGVAGEVWDGEPVLETSPDLPEQDVRVTGARCGGDGQGVDATYGPAELRDGGLVGSRVQVSRGEDAIGDEVGQHRAARLVDVDDTRGEPRSGGGALDLHRATPIGVFLAVPRELQHEGAPGSVDAVDTRPRETRRDRRDGRLGPTKVGGEAFFEAHQCIPTVMTPGWHMMPLSSRER